MNKLNIAIVGATGAVGEGLLDILAERLFPIHTLYALASSRSIGEFVSLGEQEIEVQDVATFDFSHVQLAFFAAGSEASIEYIPKATKAGCIVIDKSSQFRYDADVPLVVPEVNLDALADYKKRNLIATPNCSTIPIAVALKPIYDAAGIERINVATYQSVSGAGRNAIEELALQTAALLNAQTYKATVFPRQIAFNILPQIDDFEKNGYTKEEMKITWEMQKIFEDKQLKVNATAVRVPVFYGHAAAINIETRKKISATQARKLLENAPGIIVMDKKTAKGSPTPVTEASGEDAVYVGRIREDISHPNGLNLWVVTDNIRKGAALNAVQIAEILVKNYL